MPKIIGNTIGNLVAGEIAGRGRSKGDGKPIDLLAEVKDGSYSASVDAVPLVEGGMGGPGEDFTVRGKTHSFEFSENGNGTTLSVILAGGDDPALLLDMANQLHGQGIPIANTIADLASEIGDLDPGQQLSTIQNAYNILNSDASKELSYHSGNQRLDELINEFNLGIAGPLIANGSIFGTWDVKNPINHTGYNIKNGDTLSAIALSNGVSLADLASANSISDLDHIRAGTSLIIPTDKYLTDTARREGLFNRLAGQPTGVRANQLAGTSREALVRSELATQYPNAVVQNEVYLRTANGKRAIDPLSGEGRRIDFVVIQNGRALDSVEVTKWLGKVDNGMPPEDVSLLEKALKKVRSAQ